MKAYFSPARLRNPVLVLGTAGIALLLLLFSDAARRGAADALSLCGGTLIPTIFPFLCLTQFFCLSGASDWLSGRLKPVGNRLFSSCGAYAFVFVLSCFGGYPAGAAALMTLRRERRIDYSRSSAMLCFCVNPSPAFLVAAVGKGLYGSAGIGWMMAAAGALSSLLMGLVFSRAVPRLLHGREPLIPLQKPPHRPVCDSFVAAVASGASSMFSVCASVIFCSALCGILRELPFLNEPVRQGISSFFESASGSLRLAQSGMPPVLPAALLAFGGLSVHAQIFAVCGENAPPVPLFFGCRVLHGFLTALTMRLLLRYCPPAPVTALAAGNTSVLLSASPYLSVLLMVSAAVLLYSLGFSDFKEKEGYYEKRTLFSGRS